MVWWVKFFKQTTKISGRAIKVTSDWRANDLIVRIGSWNSGSNNRTDSDHYRSGISDNRIVNSFSRVCSNPTQNMFSFQRIINSLCDLFLSATIWMNLMEKLHFTPLNYISFYTCKDLIWLESKTGMDPGPRSPNNEFIECRKES